MTKKKDLNIEPPHRGLKETTAIASYFFSCWRVSPFNLNKFSILIGCGRDPTASVTTASARKGRSTAKDTAMGEGGTVSM